VTLEPSPDNSTKPSPPEPGKGSVFVMITIVLTILVGLSMVVLIYIGWVRYSEPSSMIVIEADEAWDGVTVEIAPIRSHNVLGRRIPVELSEQNVYTARFYLEPGPYELAATKSGYVLFRSSFQLPDGRALRQSLRGIQPSTGPATVPVARPAR
jgi:hypothetical protein